MLYTIRYNRNTNHIAGITERTKGSDFTYAQSACAALTRSGTRMATGKSSDDLAEILADARSSARATGRKLCTTCEKAAEMEIAAIEAETAAAAEKIAAETAEEVEEIQTVPTAPAGDGYPILIAYEDGRVEAVRIVASDRMAARRAARTFTGAVSVVHLAASDRLTPHLTDRTRTSPHVHLAA
jgi:hypothetical protein